jgi:hypothetical protein
MGRSWGGAEVFVRRCLSRKERREGGGGWEWEAEGGGRRWGTTSKAIARRKLKKKKVETEKDRSWMKKLLALTTTKWQRIEKAIVADCSIGCSRGMRLINLRVFFFYGDRCQHRLFLTPNLEITYLTRASLPIVKNVKLPKSK